jgi:hypothetical protein
MESILIKFISDIPPALGRENLLETEIFGSTGSRPDNDPAEPSSGHLNAGKCVLAWFFGICNQGLRNTQGG